MNEDQTTPDAVYTVNIVEVSRTFNKKWNLELVKLNLNNNSFVLDLNIIDDPQDPDNKWRADMLIIDLETS